MASLDSLPGSTIIRVAYGARSAAQRDLYVGLAEQALESARRGLVPGAFVAELIPIMKYIPSWLPGGSARKFAAHYEPRVREMRDLPFEEVKSAMVSSSYSSHSFDAKTILCRRKVSPSHRLLIT